MITKMQAIEVVSRKADELTALSDAIWDHPEVKYQETFACALLSGHLRENGFRITEQAAGIPTAFIAEYGSGRPVIGILAEYDALERMSQKAEATVQEPVTEDAPGHGCGHNLLGVGSLGAALAVKAYLESGRSGTVRFFGCPAEEGGSGKTFMAREGVFDSLDAVFTWHPDSVNAVSNGTTLANCGIRYHFSGKPSHAALSPERGRSALDAVELMNIGVQFLREHMPSDARIHYAITDAGGTAPNVVQAEAEVLYVVRSPQLPAANELVGRVNNIARGAALMTGTTVSIRFEGACSNVLLNTVLAQVMQKNFEELDSASYDEADLRLAEKIKAVIRDGDDYYPELVKNIRDESVRTEYEKDVGSALYSRIIPLDPSENLSMSSSDVGDVSWICPTAQISVVTMPGPTVMHSWQAVAVGKSSFAHKGMLQAARVIAASAIDLINDPAIAEKAKAEHVKRTGGRPYHCPLPADIPVPAP